jgi:hypothetical protein
VKSVLGLSRSLEEVNPGHPTHVSLVCACMRVRVERQLSPVSICVQVSPQWFLLLAVCVCEPLVSTGAATAVLNIIFMSSSSAFL